MTKNRPQSIAEAFGVVITVLFLILLAVGFAFGQENTGKNTGNHEHKSNALIGLNNRVSAVTVHHIEPIDGGHRLEASASSGHRIESHLMTITKEGEIDAEILKKPRNKFAWLVWCGDDQFVYLLLAIRPEQIKKGR